MASQRDDERDEQPAASQSDDKPEWRSARVTGEGGNNDCRGCAVLTPSGSMCFAPSGWRGMQTVGRGATMRLVVRLNLLNLLNLLSLLNLLNLLNTRLGVDMYSMYGLECCMGCDTSF